jgi:pantetheine-phosphate adenylyltransferase
MHDVIYPGTFDPPTLGHLNVVQRAASKFNKVIVAIGKNSSKRTPVFSLEERIHLFKAITIHIPNVEVMAFNGLLVDFAQSQNIKIIIRAIRTIFDFEYETLQAQMNRQLGNIETFYLVVDEKFRLISSTLVREIASHGKRLIDFVPSEIEEAVSQKLSQNIQ